MPYPWKRRFFGILSFVLLFFLLVSLDLVPSLAKAESTHLVTDVDGRTAMNASQGLSTNGSPFSTVVSSKEALLQGYGVEKRDTPYNGDTFYKGDGYVSFFYDYDSNSGKSDGTATFKVNVPTAGLYRLSLGYYIPAGTGSKDTSIEVNGTMTENITLAAPPKGASMNEKVVTKIMLNAGTNELTFSRGWGYYGIEYVKVEFANLPAAISKIEAEEGAITGEVSIEATDTGYSGTGYAAIKGTGSLTLAYNAASSGLYNLAIGYSNPTGDKKTHLVVNGQTSEISLPATASYTEVSGGKLMLNSGNNTIQFNVDSDRFHLDYVKLSAVSPPKLHQIEKKPVNPNATAETKALMRYLVDSYGSHILSGQHTLEDAQWIKDHTGKYPAILSTDMMDYSPSRVEHGATSTEVEKAIQWAKEGGIVTFAWHWNAPKGLQDIPGKEWWRGFYTDATTFDVQYALNHPESEEYQLMLRDIDAIAAQLKRLQDAHVPVLWRPLHEAEGKWFWWGAQGPESAKQLYRIMYDRLTHYHHLNNLIWVWNSESPDWYPGDDVVDIVSVDIYNQAANYNPSIGKYDSLVNLVQDKKLVGLSENGPIGDPELLQAYSAHWLFFTTWTGDFVRNGQYNSLDHLIKVFNSDYVITRDELPQDLFTSSKNEVE
ncbi:glycosyl hydrolase [Paenibacillus sp. CMAA1739]|uniref:glycosyl hydrolase n=1 Tax=Paenibacillus ottowii TaxID=2315729 RepID=UPI00272F91EE|nr:MULTISPECIES: glycosyl hydrolase [Paenibacillus]MDP1512389.1 glycosyl hydrolase [Paenibacillus ottowii]MEC4568358.1 glycosyl hydrolase [Paenibacillus sp. CMAA1739]